MFKSICLYCHKLLFIVFVVVSSSSYAQEPQKVAVLDLGQVIFESLAMKDIDRQFKKLENTFKEKTKTRDIEFRADKQRLDEQRAIISAEQFRDKVKALNEKGLKYRNEFNANLRQLTLSRSAAIQKIEKAMEPIVSEVANSVGATMIVEKKKILFGTKNLNITEMVSDKLNKKLTKLKLELVPLKNSN